MAKWLSVRLWTKWLWVRVPLLSVFCIMKIFCQQICKFSFLPKQARNQNFYREGEVSWNYGTSKSILLKTQVKKAPQEKVLEFFLLDTPTTTIWLENLTQRTQSGLFSQKLGHFFRFSKKDFLKHCCCRNLFQLVRLGHFLIFNQKCFYFVLCMFYFAWIATFSEMNFLWYS